MLVIFSECSSFDKDTYDDYDEYKAKRYIFDKRASGMTVFQIVEAVVFFADKAIYIIQHVETICLSLKTFSGVL